MIRVTAVCDVCGTDRVYNAGLVDSIVNVLSGEYLDIRDKLLCGTCQKKYQKVCAEISAKQKLEWDGVMEKVKDVKLEGKVDF